MLIARCSLACVLAWSIVSPAAAISRDEDRYLTQAKPLVEKFLNDKAREFGADLTIDPSSWQMHHSFLEIFISSYYVPEPHGAPYPVQPVQFICREVTVDLPNRGARAHFYVAKKMSSAAGDHQSDELILIESCAALAGKTPRMQLESLRPIDRRFTKSELATHAAPLIENLLKLNKLEVAVDPRAVRVRHGWRWIYDWLLERNRECRDVKFWAGNRKGIARLLVSYDEPNLDANLPIQTQSLHKDSLSLRTFRFALVRGCFGSEQNEAPTLELEPPTGI